MDIRHFIKDIRDPFPKFSYPRIVGSFSVNKNREYIDSMINLKYLKIPEEINFNLNSLEENYTEKSLNCSSDENLRHITTFLMKNNMKFKGFVCFRGLLRLIMCTPYDKRESWIINAISFKGTIYLCAEETIEKKNKKMSETEENKKFSRYGFKFEKFILKSHDDLEDESVNENEEFSVMFQTVLNGINLLYAAEVDGVEGEKIIKNIQDLQQTKLVEVKVKRRELTDRQLINFYKFKGISWWCQSFLVGIEKIVVGLRDDFGVVDEVTSINLGDINNEARMRNYWHGNVCMNFLSEFLHRVRYDLRKFDDPNVIFQYSFKAFSNVIDMKKVEGKTFLEKEFIDYMSNG